MSIVNILLFVIFVFMTGPVCPILGVANGNTLHLVVLALLCIFNNHLSQVLKKDKCLANALLFFVFMLIVTFIMSRGDLVNVIGWVTIPILCSLVLALDKKSLKGVQSVLFVFFVAECLLSIYERNKGVAIFPYVADEDNYYLSLVDQGQNWQFRSSSLLGNPLYNANFVSFALCVFLCCDKIKVIYKYLLALLGLFAILGFNARGATIVTFCLVLYKLYMILQEDKSKINKYLLYALIIVSLCYSIDFVVNSDWGGRLMQDELLDGSAQARLSLDEYFKYISIISFPSWLENVNKSENSYLFILISYGLFMGFFLIFYLIKLFFHFTKIYTRQVMLLLLISGIGIGSMNNNLASPSLYSWFFLYLLAFRNHLTIKNRHESPLVK